MICLTEGVLILNIAFGLIASGCLLLFSWILFRYWDLLFISSATIPMQKPLRKDGLILRVPKHQNSKTNKLVSCESVSRTNAYKNTVIQTGEAFFDDSDMSSDYNLVVIYERRKNTPLLSARYYFDHNVITHSLNGDKGQEPERAWLSSSLDLSTYGENEIFLADRLSGNVNSALYRRYRNYIFYLFYFEIFRKNMGSKFILMARKDKYEKLLTKYLRLGLDIAGQTRLRGKEHWILFGDLKKILRMTQSSILINVYLVLKLLPHRFIRR